MVLPKVLYTYYSDFGGSDEKILRFVFRYLLSEEMDEETVVRDVCARKNLMIRYEWILIENDFSRNHFNSFNV